MEESIKKAAVLIEALPYIKQFHKKVIVIKYGGSILGEEKIRSGVLEDITFLNFMGLRPVLVHGGGPNISERMKREGRKTEFIEGMRVTDESTLKVVEEELERINRQLTEQICSLGALAMGLSGKKDGFIRAKKKKAKMDLGLVGEVSYIDTPKVLSCLEAGRISVVCPMGVGPEEKTYNINADEVAHFLAVALKAEKLVLLTNVRGIMRNPEDEASLISTLTIDKANKLIEDKVIQEGMIPKVKACIDALQGGVHKTHIVDARIPHALLLEIFTDRGVGTEIVL